VSFALQDEPERGHRWMVLGFGALVAAALWGGGIAAASRYESPRRTHPRASVVRFLVPPPPKLEPAPKVTEPPPEPVVEAPKPKPETRKPKKRKPKKRKPKVAKRPRKPKPPPAQPSATPPKPAPVQLGITLRSTSARGRGPAIQVGNALGGTRAGRAKAPVTSPAPGGDELRPGAPTPESVRTIARVKKQYRPKYTRHALRQGVSGRVVVLVTIESNGTVSKAKLVKGLGAGLDEAAIGAVRRWLFEPATLDGAAIRSKKRVTVDFVLES